MTEPYSADAVRAQVKEWQPNGGFASKKNAYECEDCGSWIVTIDREQGVTPFMIQCGNCKATAKSKLYRVSEHLEPTHEWFRPETIDGLSKYVADHVQRGGLLLRRIGGGDKSEGWQSAGKQYDEVAMKREAILAETRAKIEALEQEKEKILRKMAEPSPIRRGDYPSRQAYRRAVSQHRKGKL